MYSPAFYVWLAGSGISLLLFVLGVQQAQLPNRGLVACLGAIACFVALAALTQITRQGVSPASTVGAIVIYVVGIGVSLIFSCCYAFFFMFWHAKNF